MVTLVQAPDFRKECGDLAVGLFHVVAQLLAQFAGDHPHLRPHLVAYGGHLTGEGIADGLLDLVHGQPSPGLIREGCVLGCALQRDRGQDVTTRPRAVAALDITAAA